MQLIHDLEEAVSPEERLANAKKEEANSAKWSTIIFFMMLVMFLATLKQYNEFSSQIPDIKPIMISVLSLYGISSLCHCFWMKRVTLGTL